MSGFAGIVRLDPAREAVRNLLSRDWPVLLACCSPLRDATSLVRFMENATDISPMLALAEAHGVTAQLAAALNQYRTEHEFSVAFPQLRDAQRRQALSTILLTAELFRALDLFVSASIECVVIKGPVLSVRAFGDPAARHYGDIDLLLRHADIQRASHQMISAGFQSAISANHLRAGKTPGQYFFRRPQTGAALELHTERTLRYFPRPLPIGDFFARKSFLSIDSRQVPALSLEDEFVLISIHGAKHFWERLMWISDIAALVQHHPELDWARVRRSAAAVGAERMVRVALLLAERLLHVPVPQPMEAEVARDAACSRIVAKIEAWLPYAGYEPPAITQRALFRLRMRGHLLAGARYLTRLSLSTTEEDWSSDIHSTASALAETLRRPFRLAKKYRRKPSR